MLMAIFMVCSTPDKQNVKGRTNEYLQGLSRVRESILVGGKLIRPFLMGEARSPRET
jgi:hypothetical protein